MRINAITNNETGIFCNMPQAESIKEQTIQKFFNNGMSKPEWCFIAKKDEEYIARVGFMTGGRDDHLNMFGLHLAQTNGTLTEEAHKFLTEIFKKLKEMNILNICYHLDNATENHLQILNVLKKSGMTVSQTKKSYILELANYQRKEPNYLEYKPLSEVGKNTFLEAFKLVAEGTLDREDARCYEKSGLQKGVEEHFDLLQELGDPNDNWYLAYVNDDLAGLIIPQKFNDEVGAINYIGVVPRQRGHHYVADLLQKGVENLFNRGIQRIIADIDDLNTPMDNALKQIGFKEENKIWVLNKEF